MAVRLATVTGNFLTAGTWVASNTGTNAVLTHTASSGTNLLTSNLDSATFQPAAQASRYLAVRMSTRAAGSPTNTMTVKLRNATTAADIWTFVINVSDLPVCTTTDDDGGWLVFKAAADHTPNGTDNYTVRVALSSTSTGVALATNGTSNNWLRMLFRSATGAPVAGEDMQIAGIYDTTNPAVRTDVVVTMNETAATDYGTASTNYRVAALNVSKGGTLLFDTAVNSLLRLSGHLCVYSGGTVTQGSVATPIPSGKTSIIEFDCAADNDFGYNVRNGTWTSVGVPRTAGKNFTWTLMTADAAAAANSLTVQDDTGWLNGDSIVIASTSQTRGETETATLNAGAGASSLSLSAGLANAHGGSASTKVQAEVIMTNRNVTIRAVTAGFMAYGSVFPSANFTAKWTNFDKMGGTNVSFPACLLQTTTGTVIIQYCHFSAQDGYGIRMVTGTMANVLIDNNTSYNGGGEWLYGDVATTDTTWSVTNNVVLASTASVAAHMNMKSFTGTVSGNRTAGAANYGIRFLGTITGGTLTNHISHSNATSCFYDGAQDSAGFTLSGGAFWRSGNGIQIGGICSSFTMSNVTVFGNLGGAGSCGLWLQNTTPISDFVIDNCTFAGDTTRAQTFGILSGSYITNMRIYSSTFGLATGIYVAHGTSDIRLGTTRQEIYLFNTKLASTTELDSAGASTLMTATAKWSFVSSQKHDQSAGIHKTICPVGSVTIETTTVDVSPSIKMTPIFAGVNSKLDTSGNALGAGFYVPVDNGSTPTVSIKVQKDASYNGNAPRLILKRNDAIGILADAVIDTFSGGSGSWDTLTGTTAAATDDGVMEFVVDCDGTAGNIFVDTFTVTGAGTSPVSGLKYWFAGLAC